MRDRPPREPSDRSPHLPQVEAGGMRERGSVPHPRAAGVSALEPERLYRLLVESVRDYAIFALDPSGHILSWNAGAQRLKGYNAEEIIGRHFSIFYPAEDIAAGKPDYALIIAAQEGRVEDEGWRVRKDGTRFWANEILTALRQEPGKLVGYVKITRDLTERRLAEESIRQSSERYELLVRSVKDYAIFMLDPAGRVATWNEGAQRIKGYTAEEIIGRHFSEFYPAEDIARGKPQWELKTAAAEGRVEDEDWRLRKDGTRFWANIIITALRNSRGELVGFAKVTRDLTERQAAQERALATARRLAEVEAANRTKAEFLAAMSHELRTPLNAIGGYAEILAMGLRGAVTQEQQLDLERIRSSQQHLLAIINDILNYSRIEAGQISYTLGPVPLLAVADAVTPMVELQAIRKGLTLERGPCDPNAVARADFAKVEQILVNLFSNAVKFTPSGGQVTFSCVAAAGEQVAMSVSDTGPGIPPEKRAAIFEPFVQLNRSLTSAHEGIGLGLAISRDLARAMGGELTVESAVGAGSTFTLTLPRASADQ